MNKSRSRITSISSRKANSVGVTQPKACPHERTFA
ncbi:hypothetical protein Gogos_014415 [Gossypium gossypioides]|uniref:Uncharacterized protein n=1 Tax=Gossypium gossypioides TaxID=34282 RepID=A0A7J9BYN9_GOSGO|nr:hypothetical protein [Gossypium gossypioides]